MRRQILPSTAQVEAPAFDDVKPKRELAVVVEVLMEAGSAVIVGVAGNLRDERDEAMFELVEERPELRDRHAGLVILDQCVVGMLLVAKVLCRLLLQFEDPRDMWLEKLPIRPGARFAPCSLGDRFRAGDLCDKVCRQFARTLVIAPGYLDEAAVLIITAGRRSPVKQLAEPFCRRQFVRNAA